MPQTAQTRITGGEWRGRLISTPTDRLLRPTRSMVREAIFNILGDRVVGARLVDLFAGAGTVGFEALSRGAASVVFVDRDRRALAHIEQTASRLGCADRAHTVAGDAVRWVRSRPPALAGCHLCFLDAPYADDVVDEILRVLGEAPPPLVVCEHHRGRRLEARIGALEVVRRAHYGITDVSILRPAETEATT